MYFFCYFTDIKPLINWRVGHYPFHCFTETAQKHVQFCSVMKCAKSLRPFVSSSEMRVSFWRACIDIWTPPLTPQKKASKHSIYHVSQNYDSNTNHFSVAIGFAWACKNPYSFNGNKCIAATHTHTQTLTDTHMHTKHSDGNTVCD